MNLEESIKDSITKKLEDGSIEKLVQEQLEKGVINALESMFKSYGDVTKVIEEKIKSVMVPYLESYDYSKYIVKLDDVLQEVLKESAMPNVKILKNFKTLIENNELNKIYKVSELFNLWADYISKNVSTSDLEINYDDEVSYQNLDVKMNVDIQERPSWSSFDKGTIIFECKQDEDMNFEIPITKMKTTDKWEIEHSKNEPFRSLRYTNEFQILIMKLSQSYTKIEIDEEEIEDEIEVEERPEPSYE